MCFNSISIVGLLSAEGNKLFLYVEGLVCLKIPSYTQIVFLFFLHAGTL